VSHLTQLYAVIPKETRDLTLGWESVWVSGLLRRDRQTYRTDALCLQL